jgi:hypothetical protein
VLTGDHQRVAFEHRAVVEEGHHVGVGVDDVGVGGGVAGGDVAELAVSGQRLSLMGGGR